MWTIDGHLPNPGGWNDVPSHLLASPYWSRRTTNGSALEFMTGWLPKIEPMQELRPPTGKRSQRYALASVAVALLGLLSMHGWGSHTGAHSMEAMPESANVIIAAGDPTRHNPSGPAAGEPDTSEQVGAGHPAGMDSGKPVGESGAGVLGLCLAVLAGLLLGIALLLERRGVRIPRTLLPAWQPPLFSGRDRDPPDLGMLCVIRR